VETPQQIRGKTTGQEYGIPLSGRNYMTSI